MKQTIQLKPNTKDDFEKLRFNLKRKEKRLITQDEFMIKLISAYKNEN
jgi:hypothetical protein